MKKHSITIFILWACMLIITFFGLITSLFAQQVTDTVTDTIYVPVNICDSAFMRRTNARLERQIDVNDMIFRALKDHAHAYMVLKHRFDSLAVLTEKRTQTQSRRKK